MIKRSSCFLVIMIVFVSSLNSNSGATEKETRFTTALKLVEMTFNKEAVYQQFIYFGILPAKERYESNPKTKKYSEILVGVIKEVLDAYFNDLETQKQLKNVYATLYSEEFTLKELNDIIAFYKTDTGKKTLLKLPIVIQKGRQREVELVNGLSSSKYEQLLKEKLEKLQKDGVLPNEF